MYRTCVRLVFLLVVGLFGLQCWFISWFSEPYPALTMPAFRGTGQDEEGQVFTRNVEIVATFAAGEQAWLDVPTLFEIGPSSHYSAFARWFRPSAEQLSVNGGAASYGVLGRWFPGVAIRWQPSGRRGSSDEMAHWLESRLRVLYPGREPVAVMFVWYEDRFDLSGAEVVREREERGRRHIEFGGDEDG